MNKITAAALVALVVGLGGVARPADAATPARTVNLSVPTFGVGTTLDIETDDEPDPTVEDYSADYTFHWTVSGPSVCAQTFISDEHEGGLETYDLSTTARSFDSGGDFYSQHYGEDDSVSVQYCDGTSAVSNIVHPYLGEFIDDNGGLGTTTTPVPTYFGAWTLSKCLCAAFRTTHFTTQKNASFSFRAGGSFGIAMSRAPNRGSAALYVDGVKKAVINTYSTTAINSTFVYSTLLPGKATHTIEVVNLATAGHPRIDLDAVAFVDPNHVVSPP